MGYGTSNRGNQMTIKRFVLAGACAVLVLAACGDDDNAATDTTDNTASSVESTSATSAGSSVDTTSATTADSSVDTTSDSSVDTTAAGQDELQSLLTTQPDFPYPDTPVDIGEHRVAVIASGRGPSGMEDWSAINEAILSEVGWTFDSVSDGKFNPSDQATLVQQAVLDEVDAIILLSVIPSQIPEAIKAAQDANIPIVCELCMPDSTEGIIHVGPTGTTMGTIEGQLMAAALPDDAKVVIVRVDEVNVLVEQADAIEATLTELCPGCSQEVANMSIADLGSPVIPALANILQTYDVGEIDAVQSPFAAVAENMLQVAKQQGRDDFKVFNVAGTAPWADFVSQGTDLPVAYADVMYPYEWMGYASIDLAARAIEGLPLWDATTDVPGMPLMQDNASTVRGPNGLWMIDGAQETFYSLWGR
jgi:ABC-type sugar transport system substrate-binding protein